MAKTNTTKSKPTGRRPECRVPLQLATEDVHGHIRFACRHHVSVVYRGTPEALTRIGAMPASLLQMLRSTRRQVRQSDEFGKPIWISGFWGKRPRECAEGEIQITRMSLPNAALNLPGVTLRAVREAAKQSQQEAPSPSSDFYRVYDDPDLRAGPGRCPYLRLVVDNTRSEVLRS